MASRKKMSLFVRTSIDSVFDKVRSYTAIVEKGISFGWCSITNNDLPAIFGFNEESQQAPFRRRHLATKSQIRI